MLEAQSEVTDLHEQLMKKLVPDDSLFNDDWIAEVHVSVDKCSSEVNEYLLSRVNDLPLDVMSNTAWVEDYLEKSEKHVTEREQLSDLATQLNQLTITVNQQIVHADVHDKKEALSVRKSSGAFHQLQHPLEIQVDKWRDGEYRRTLSAEARPFAAFQRNTVTMDLSDNCSAYRKKEELSVDAWIDQLSVHGRERPAKLTSMDHLSITWPMQQNFPRIQIPVFDSLPTKWLEFVLKSKNLASALQFLKSTQRITYILQH